VRVDSSCNVFVASEGSSLVSVAAVGCAHKFFTHARPACTATVLPLSSLHADQLSAHPHGWGLNKSTTTRVRVWDRLCRLHFKTGAW
jgi:hypothetical protein